MLEDVLPGEPKYRGVFHPNGSSLALVTNFGGASEIFRVSRDGRKVKRLTFSPSIEVSPTWSPDGERIAFVSDRSGSPQIFVMNADGSEQEQMTFDEYNDWFPHPSPDGKWLVFLSYMPDVEGHPPNKDVMLRIMPAEGGDVEVLTRLFGGQGTINVPSWSPDSEEVAFVSYDLQGSG